MSRYFSILSIILFILSGWLVQGCKDKNSTNKTSATKKVIFVKNSTAPTSNMLKGTVKLKGNVPQDKDIVIDRNINTCGNSQKTNKYIVSNSRIKNVVVWIDNPKKGKALPKKTVKITIKRCEVKPRVNIGFVGGSFLAKNEDPILHTLQLKLWLAYQKKVSSRPLADGISIYNFAMPKQNMQIKKPIKHFHRYRKDTGLIRVTSNAHNWMRGYIFIFDHPYAAITDEKGTFVINDLAPGEYILKAWHEGFGFQKKRIKISSDKGLEVELEFGK